MPLIIYWVLVFGNSKALYALMYLLQGLCVVKSYIRGGRVQNILTIRENLIPGGERSIGKLPLFIFVFWILLKLFEETPWDCGPLEKAISSCLIRVRERTDKRSRQETSRTNWKLARMPIEAVTGMDREPKEMKLPRGNELRSGSKAMHARDPEMAQQNIADAANQRHIPSIKASSAKGPSQLIMHTCSGKSVANLTGASPYHKTSISTHIQGPYGLACECVDINQNGVNTSASMHSLWAYQISGASYPSLPDCI
ncbi:hypothetical protein VNO77_02900 [Canavalia gladiata]|uniref:Uncharacterized protein n=1 Tax=Canavalia gladiata TaxID=3824 RepID=A0AAN9MYS9_CANGL